MRRCQSYERVKANEDRGNLGFSLIELLVVISIIAMLVSILMPVLHSARNEATTTKCLANIREIAQATAMYMDAQEGRRVVPWYQFPAHGGDMDNSHGTYDIGFWTPWVFGGFKAPHFVDDDTMVDAEVYPVHIRPLNRYVDHSAQGDDIIKLFICPADRTNSTPIIQPGEDPVVEEEETYSSWQVNGSSYSLNTRFMQGYHLPDGFFNLREDLEEYTDKIAKHLVGGGAASFIMWTEQGFYSSTYQARPTLAESGAIQRMGWHRRFSAWSVGFADGHARYGYYDTRLTYGLDGTIWQPNFNP